MRKLRKLILEVKGLQSAALMAKENLNDFIENLKKCNSNDKAIKRQINIHEEIRDTHNAYYNELSNIIDKY